METVTHFIPWSGGGRTETPAGDGEIAEAEATAGTLELDFRQPSFGESWFCRAFFCQAFFRKSLSQRRPPPRVGMGPVWMRPTTSDHFSERPVDSANLRKAEGTCDQRWKRVSRLPKAYRPSRSYSSRLGTRPFFRAMRAQLVSREAVPVRRPPGSGERPAARTASRYPGKWGMSLQW